MILYFDYEASVVENTGYEYFHMKDRKKNKCASSYSPFPTTFSTLSQKEIVIFVMFNLSSANASNLVWSKILSCGNGLSHIIMRAHSLSHSLNFGIRFTCANQGLWSALPEKSSTEDRGYLLRIKLGHIHAFTTAQVSTCVLQLRHELNSFAAPWCNPVCKK